MSAVLRVAGRDVDVNACRAWLPPRIRLERVWQAGEPGRLGVVTKTSGFAALLSEAKGEDLVEEALKVFVGIADHVDELVAAGAQAELDFAKFVGAQEPRTFIAEPELLRELGKHRIKLIISAYPTAEDDE